MGQGVASVQGLLSLLFTWCLGVLTPLFLVALFLHWAMFAACCYDSRRIPMGLAELPGPAVSLAAGLFLFP